MFDNLHDPWLLLVALPIALYVLIAWPLAVRMSMRGGDCAACQHMPDGKACLRHTCPDCAGVHPVGQPCV